MMTRDELIAKLLADLGADDTESARDTVEVFVADEKNLEWFEQGNATWEDELRWARDDANNCRIALEAALKELGR